ncbi:MAG: hypothetical protein J1F06_05465, partial [Prevotellaceae bacterium]|nr:hypothetical protein [Prevotellaceae bacterium]
RFATPGYKNISEEFMAKQMRRDGIDPDKADANAKSEYRRSILRDLARIGIFGYALQLAWNLAAYIPYLLSGEDEDEKDKMWDDVMNHSMFGSIEGLTGGDVMSSAGQMWMNGNGNWSYLVKDMPLASDVSNILKKFPKDEAAAMNDVINLLVQSGLGVNPQSLTDAIVAIMDACGDDADTSRECALLIARIINCPQSQIDKIYFDELGTDGKEARKMTPAEIAERYAEYKSLREAPLTGWMRPEEKTDSIKSKKERYALKVAKEKIGKSIANDETRMLLKEYDEVSKRKQAIDKLWETDREGYRNGRRELRKTTDMRRHNRVKRYKRDMRELTEKYLRTKSVDELNRIAEQMIRTRDKMIEDIHAKQ